MDYLLPGGQIDFKSAALYVHYQTGFAHAYKTKNGVGLAFSFGVGLEFVGKEETR